MKNLIPYLFSILFIFSLSFTSFANENDFEKIYLLANQGNKVAQEKLASIYYSRNNYKEAVKWWEKSSIQGYDYAQLNLGNCYYFGEGVEQNYKKAVEWYKKAAIQGEPSAMSNLARCYYDGIGVRQNYKEAKEWFGKLCDDGYQYGCDAYKELNLKGY